jgi:hypothetical protein
MSDEKEKERVFEPASYGQGLEIQPLVSIAISLKRLADAWGKQDLSIPDSF